MTGGAPPETSPCGLPKNILAAGSRPSGRAAGRSSAAGRVLRACQRAAAGCGAMEIGKSAEKGGAAPRRNSLVKSGRRNSVERLGRARRNSLVALQVGPRGAIPCHAAILHQPGNLAVAARPRLPCPQPSSRPLVTGRQDAAETHKMDMAVLEEKIGAVRLHGWLDKKTGAKIDDELELSIAKDLPQQARTPCHPGPPCRTLAILWEGGGVV